MADRELVIKIPEKVYNALTHTEFDANLVVDEMRASIVTGTPLHKGHGRMGDLDALQEEVSSWGMNDYEPSDFIDAINDADTIIEADKESEGT